MFAAPGPLRRPGASISRASRIASPTIPPPGLATRWVLCAFDRIEVFRLPWQKRTVFRTALIFPAAAAAYFWRTLDVLLAYFGRTFGVLLAYWTSVFLPRPLLKYSREIVTRTSMPAAGSESLRQSCWHQSSRFCNQSWRLRRSRRALLGFGESRCNRRETVWKRQKRTRPGNDSPGPRVTESSKSKDT